MEALERFGAARPAGSSAGGTWFGLGDRDLATHLYRTHRLREGARLTEVTAEVARAYGVAVRLLPVTDDPVRTMVQVAGEGEIGFQDYFVRRRHQVPITGVRFDGADAAEITPEVAATLRTRSSSSSLRPIRSCPSGPCWRCPASGARLGTPCAGRGRVTRRRPGPQGTGRSHAGRAGAPVSVAGVARLYRDVAGTLIIDERDRALAGDVEAEGVRCIVTDTVMRTPEVSAALGRTVLTAGRGEHR